MEDNSLWHVAPPGVEVDAGPILVSNCNRTPKKSNHNAPERLPVQLFCPSRTLQLVSRLSWVPEMATLVARLARWRQDRVLERRREEREVT